MYNHAKCAGALSGRGGGGHGLKIIYTEAFLFILVFLVQFFSYKNKDFKEIHALYLQFIKIKAWNVPFSLSLI